MKKIPDRMCISCKQMKSKDQLIKLVKTSDQIVEIEKNKKLDGRGAYVCKSNECIEKCIKQKMLNRSFKCNINNKIYEDLKELFKIEKQ